MKNSIDVSVKFDFKGEAYSPSLTIDLDQFLKNDGSFESIYSVLAKTNGIDTYSYLYEVMQTSDVSFSNAEGLATNHLKENCFDLESFKAEWHESQVLNDLQLIAAQELGVVALADNQPLKKALVQAYRRGCESKKK